MWQADIWMWQWYVDVANYQNGISFVWEGVLSDHMGALRGYLTPTITADPNFSQMNIFIRRIAQSTDQNSLVKWLAFFLCRFNSINTVCNWGKSCMIGYELQYFIVSRSRIWFPLLVQCLRENLKCVMHGYDGVLTRGCTTANVIDTCFGCRIWNAFYNPVGTVDSHLSCVWSCGDDMACDTVWSVGHCVDEIFFRLRGSIEWTRGCTQVPPTDRNGRL